MLASILNTVVQSGVPESTVLLLLFLPILSTFVAFTRYIIGWKSLTIYASLLLTYALYDISSTSFGSIDILRGFVNGGTLIICSIIIAYMFHSFTREVRLHHIAKISLIVTIISLSTIGLLYLSTQFGYVLALTNPLAMVIIILIVDIFIRGLVRKGPEKSGILLIQTILLSYFMLYVMSLKNFSQLILSHPEIVLYSILINILIGRWKGMRWNEFIRFRSIKLSEPPSTYDSEDLQAK